MSTRQEKLNDKWARIIGIPGVGLLLHFTLHDRPDAAAIIPSWTQTIITMVVTAIIWEFNRSIVLFFRKKFPGHSKTARRILLQFGSSLAGSAALLLLISMLIGLFIPACWNRNMMLINLASGIAATLLITTIYECVYFFQKWRDSIIETENLKRENLRFQFEALKSQVNPHFLFNSLNTLTSLIEEDPKNAVQFVQHLSQVYRYVLTTRDKNLIPLDEEIGFIRSYVFLLEMRFGNNFTVHIDIPEQHAQQQLPPLALQLLVENAIKHNVVSAESPLRLTITVNRKGQLFVENNIRRKQSVETSSGFGLRNIVNRYKLLGRNDIEISDDQYRFSVALPLL